MMDQDDDVLDLGEPSGDGVLGGTESVVQADASAEQAPAGPSETELKMARRVLELEKERDALKAELQEARSPAPTVVQPGHRPIVVPNELMPVLAMLQQHIADLTRDNETMRFLFYGESQLQETETSMSKVSLQSPIDPDGFAGALNREVVRNVDMEGMLRRVKEVMRENSELGEMLLEAGERGAVDEWEQALEESKAVITSLDADLNQHLGVIEALRAELEALKSQQASAQQRDTEASTFRSERPRNRDSQQRGHGRSGQNDRYRGPEHHRDHDRDRQRDKNMPHDARQPGPSSEARGNTPQRSSVGPASIQQQIKQPVQLSVKGRAGSASGQSNAGKGPRGGPPQSNGGAQPHSRTDSAEGDRDTKRRR